MCCLMIAQIPSLAYSNVQQLQPSATLLHTPPLATVSTKTFNTRFSRGSSKCKKGVEFFFITTYSFQLVSRVLYLFDVPVCVWNCFNFDHPTSLLKCFIIYGWRPHGMFHFTFNWPCCAWSSRDEWLIRCGFFFALIWCSSPSYWYCAKPRFFFNRRLQLTHQTFPQSWDLSCPYTERTLRPIKQNIIT